MGEIDDIRRRRDVTARSGDRYVSTTRYLVDVGHLLSVNADLEAHVRILVDGIRATVDLLEQASLAAEATQVRRMMRLAGVEDP